MHKSLKKRECQRFEIPGSTICYKKESFLLSRGNYTENFYPVLDISRGGVSFLAMERLSINDKLQIKIFVTEGESPLLINGTVKWVSVSPGKSYRYQIGVQFHPYGKNKGHNEPESLERLKAYEKKFNLSGTVKNTFGI
ncbi:MAG: PilZ domain-containing protein [Thermodesulfobacteriota bacterium]|nr:PilZ domain-containing protein [Thermodesulfobacteriota bacterium]